MMNSPLPDRTIIPTLQLSVKLGARKASKRVHLDDRDVAAPAPRSNDPAGALQLHDNTVSRRGATLAVSQPDRYLRERGTDPVRRLLITADEAQRPVLKRRHAATRWDCMKSRTFFSVSGHTRRPARSWRTK